MCTAVELHLGVRLNPKSFKTIKLSDIDLQKTVLDLKMETAIKMNLSEFSFDLVYCGCVLEDEATVESSGLKNGSVVHVIGKKSSKELPAPAKTFSEASISQLASAFKSFNENPVLRSALHRLSKRPEVIENIILTSPGLNDDPIAIAFLQDPDLMAHFTEPYTVQNIAKSHPVLLEAAQHVVAAVHEEAHNDAANGGPSSITSAPSTAYSYSLDNMSDDEAMAGDSSQSSDSTQQSNLGGRSSNSAITTAQLASALNTLARARGLRFPLSSSSSSTSTTSAGGNSGVITTEMFSQAMQQAFANSSASSLGTSTASPPPPPPLPPSPASISHSPMILPPVLPQMSDLQRQLAQMHEMGLQDDAVNLQALQFTNGDVQAAIELVFSGFSDN